MKKIIIITIFLLIILMVINLNTICYAAEGESGLITNTEDYKPSVRTDGDFTSILFSVVGVIRTIGVMVGVISLMIIGFRALVGSAEEKAEYKKVMPGYIIGIILVVAITLIPEIIYNLAKKI